MISSADLLDLTITLAPPPDGTSTLASLIISCEALGLRHDTGLFDDPFTQQECDDLHWYLETYPDWPFAEFVAHGQQIEDQLVVIGKRLYDAVFGAGIALVTAWQLRSAERKRTKP